MVQNFVANMFANCNCFFLDWFFLKVDQRHDARYMLDEIHRYMKSNFCKYLPKVFK